MKIAIAGLGLIGGSAARALSSRTDHELYVWNRTEATARRAVEEGAAHGVLTDAILSECDAVLVCLWPRAAVEWVRAKARRFKPGALVLDACGVKGAVCRECGRAVRESGAWFVGGHPMAGREVGGYDASLEHLFDGSTMILVPLGAPEDIIGRARTIAESLGCARTISTLAEEHDAMIAYTSQLPHALSYSYIASDRSRGCAPYAAGSFRDISRVASSDEAMWSELFAMNSDALGEELDAMISRLTDLRDAVRARDEDRIASLLRAGRRAKEAFEKGQGA